jgi:filamentous hemagglutinin family protein
MSSKQYLRFTQLSKLWNRCRVVVIVLGVFSGVQSPAIAQSITTDGTVGTPQTLTGPDYTIPQSAGQTAGSNLFHSFERFNLNAGEAAVFQSNPAIQNIFSRVTGGESSLINGTLATQGQQVNLFFINPNGIVFGPNAQLNVTGSFLATTADHIRFADGTQFSATSPRQSSVLTVGVPVGLQFGTRPSSILVQGNGREADGTATVLTAGANQTLALIGGDIALEGGGLGTFGGQLEIGSVEDGSFVELNPTGQTWMFDYSNVSNFGDVLLDRQSTIFAQDAKLNGIQIHTGSLTLRDGSEIQSVASEQGRTGNIVVKATDNITLTGGEQFQSFISSNRSGSSSSIGGDIQLSTRVLSVTNGSSIDAFASNNTSGNITIQASDVVSVEGEGKGEAISLIGTFVEDGIAGSVNLQAETVQIKAGGQVFSLVSDQASVGGTVTINARDAVLVDGTAQNGDSSAILSFSSSNLAKPPGDIRINTGSLSVTNGARISTSSEGQANNGNIVIQAQGRVTVSGRSDRRYQTPSGRVNLLVSKIRSGNQSPDASGNAGNIQITARDVDVTVGGNIAASTESSGNAGNIEVNAQGLVRIDGLLFDLDGSFLPSWINSFAGFNNNGQAGNITIRTTDLQISNGGELTVSTFGQGKAGNISIAARNQVLLSGSDAGDLFSDISSNNFLGTNSGGSIQIDTGSLRVEKGAAISSFTLGIGNAGTIVVNARDAIALDGSNPVAGGSGIFSGVDVLTSQRRVEVEKDYQTRGATIPLFDEGVGAGGDIQLNARSLNLTNGAIISARSRGQGPAGNVVIRVSDTLSANDGNILNSSTKTSGGRVSIQAQAVRLSGNSDVLTNVARGEGSGGDITITANSITALDDSDILAFAQDGRGGNITLNTRAFFGQNYRPTAPSASQTTLISNGRVDVNASGAISGIVTLPDTSFIQNELTALPDVPIETETLLANSCIRRDRATGTFYVSGSGNLPTSPGNMSYSTYETAEVRSTTPQAWKPGDAIVEPQGVYTLTNGKRVISRLCLGERSS